MEQEEYKKTQIIKSFVEKNPIKITGRIAIFQAIVEYVELSIYDVTKVHVELDGFHCGHVEVFPTAKIDIEKVHTGFSVPYHTYRLDNLTLEIKGTASPAKGGKDYTVRITPV